MEEAKKQRPVHTVRLPFSGHLLEAAIWRAQGTSENKRPHFSLTLSRGYRAKDGKWEFNDFFSRDEALGLIFVLEEAHRWIIANGAQEVGQEVAENE